MRAVRLAIASSAIFALLAAFPARGQDSPAFTRWGVRQRLTTDPVTEHLLARGYELIYAREFDTARACYEFVVAMHPDCAEAHTGLGFAQRYLGNSQEGLESCRRALDLDSLAFGANWNYGELLWPWRTQTPDSVSREDRFALSIRHLQRAAHAGHAASAHAYISLWTAYMGMCDITRASAQLRELKVAGYFPQVLLDYSYNVLVGMDPGALLITGGDMDTYPLFYLQEVEGFRRDVRIVNSSLVQDRTMLKCLRDSLGFSLPPTLLFDPADVIDPSAVVSKIIQSAWDHQQPVYLAATAGHDLQLPNQCTVVMQGLALRLDADPSAGQVDVTKIVSNMKKFRLALPAQAEDWKQNLSPLTNHAHLQTLGNYVPLYAAMASDYIQRDDKPNAVACYRKIVQLCTLLENEQMLVSAAQAWWQLEPGSKEVTKLFEKHGGSKRPH